MGNFVERKEALRDAMQKVLHDFADDDSDTGIIVHFSLSMEVVGGDGTTWLKHLASDGISAWTELGMLMSAQDDIKVRMRESTTDYND